MARAGGREESGAGLGCMKVKSQSEVVQSCPTLSDPMDRSPQGSSTHGIFQADDTTLMAENEEELKSLLMQVKEESEKLGLKLNIQKTKIMASGPITSWEIDGETWKEWLTLFFWAPKSLQMVTAAMK